MSFFFVLSGFVLTWADHDHPQPRRFYRKRFARIYPAYLVTIVVAIGVIVYEGSDLALGPLLASATLVQAWIPQPAYHFAGNSIGWSLSCEALFYALFPFLVMRLLRRTTRTKIAVVVGALAAAIALQVLIELAKRHGAENTSYWGYVFPPIRLPEFIAGMALGALALEGRRRGVGLGPSITLFVGAYLAATLVPPTAEYIAVTVIPIALVIWAAARADLLRKPTFWSRPLMVRLGETSYAFFLVHQLVLRVIEHATAGTQFGAGAAVAVTLAALAASIGLARLLFVYVERPLERRIRGSAIPAPLAP